MPDWLSGALAFAREPQTWAFVICLLLIAIIDRRLMRIAASMERLSVHVVRSENHVAARMTEIRNSLYTMAGWSIPDDRRKPGTRRE